MTGKTMSKVEKEIYEKLNFTHKLLTIDNKYNNDGLTHAYFKLNEVKTLMKTIDYPYNYNGENSHSFLLRKYNDLNFKISFFIKNNSILPYFIILKEEVFFGPTITNLYSILNHLYYDESLLNPSFNINTLDDLKKYILDIIELCNKFIDEYIIAIELGKIQV